MAGTMLEQVAERMQIDLAAVQKAQQKANLLEQIAKLAWQAFTMDACLSIGVSIELDANGEPTKLTVKWQDEIYPVALSEIVGANANTNVGHGENGKAGKGNWRQLEAIAVKYGVVITDNQSRAIAWYFPDIVKKIVKANAAAKQDSELRQLAQQWISSSSAAKSRGIDSLDKMGL